MPPDQVHLILSIATSLSRLFSSWDTRISRALSVEAMRGAKKTAAQSRTSTRAAAAAMAMRIRRRRGLLCFGAMVCPLSLFPEEQRPRAFARAVVFLLIGYNKM